jgi:hypothetical protein
VVVFAVVVVVVFAVVVFVSMIVVEGVFLHRKYIAPSLPNGEFSIIPSPHLHKPINPPPFQPINASPPPFQPINTSSITFSISCWS